jgi:hypothetical protein
MVQGAWLDCDRAHGILTPAEWASSEVYRISVFSFNLPDWRFESFRADVLEAAATLALVLVLGVF